MWQVENMKISRLLVSAVAILSLGACSSSSSADTTTTTTLAPTTTTIALPDCSQDALDAAVGERETYILGCSSNWAALQPRSWECGEHCYAFIYKWDQAKWNLALKCDQYSALSADGYCTGMTGQIRDANYTENIVEFPTKDVACQIWAKSVYQEIEKNTGC
jgi:ABC-type transport system substrate-binding protein